MFHKFLTLRVPRSHLMWTLHSDLIYICCMSSWLCAGEWNLKRTRRWHHRQHCQSSLQAARLYHLIWIETVLKISAISSSSSSSNYSRRNLLFLIIANKTRFTQLIPVPSVSSMISGASKRHQIEMLLQSLLQRMLFTTGPNVYTLQKPAVQLSSAAFRWFSLFECHYYWMRSLFVAVLPATSGRRFILVPVSRCWRTLYLPTATRTGLLIWRVAPFIFPHSF